jgi:transposase
VRLIAKLYVAEARSAEWEAKRRWRLRQRYSKRVIGHIEQLLVTQRDAGVPCSLLGRALTNLSGQWPKLIRYIDHGAWPISNDPCENAIRPFVIGRRGWLFSDTVDGAYASASLCSPVETCKVHRIDP